MSAEPVPHPGLEAGSGRITQVYTTTQAGLDILVDVQLPASSFLKKDARLPVVLSFHGGALFVGSRRDAMPAVITDTLLASGAIILYPDYRLLDPNDCWDELEDIRCLRRWMMDGKIDEILPHGARVDTDRVGFIGFSAGCWMARVAVVDFLKAHASGESPFVPKACATWYGMGGDFLLDYWVTPKPNPQAKTPQHMVEKRTMPELADCPYSPGIQHETLEERASWCTFWWSSGDYLDLCLGKEGFAKKLRGIPHEKREEFIPDDMEDLFPQVFLARNKLASQWPSTLLVHGGSDPVVPVEESHHTEHQLQKLGLPVKLSIVEHGDHDLNHHATGAVLPAKAQAALETANFLIQTLCT